MGTPEDLSRCQGAGLDYGDRAVAHLERELGREASLQELATFYAAAAGGMQGACAGLLYQVSGIQDTKNWFEAVARITQAIVQGKKVQIAIDQQTTVTELSGASQFQLVPAETQPPAGNGLPEVPPAAETPEAPGVDASQESASCTCFNRSGMCVVCLESLVGRLTKAAGWIAQVQGLSGTLDADCAACTPRILDRAVANAIKKNIPQIQPKGRSKILSAVISALPQLTGLEHWDETIRMAEQLCPELVAES